MQEIRRPLGQQSPRNGGYQHRALGRAPIAERDNLERSKRRLPG